MQEVECHHSFDPVRTAIATYVPKQRYPFGAVQGSASLEELEVEITWVRESTADFLILFKDRPLRRLQRLSDHYGFLTCFKGEEAWLNRQMREWKIEPNSEVELAVRCWLIDTPTLGYIGDCTYGRAKRFTSFSNFQSRVVRRDPSLDLKTNFNEGESVCDIQHSLHKVWSSKWSVAENSAAMASFVERARETARTVGAEVEYWDREF